MRAFSKSLKSWRSRRRYSQLDLANEANVSARHLSFLETGRAKPSRDMVDRLGEALQLTLAARNQLLVDAGYAAQFERRDWLSAQMAPIRQAISHMLTRHSPYPGFALDDRWTVIDANDSALFLFGRFGFGIGDSLLDLMLSQDLAKAVENWPEVAFYTAQRLRTEGIAYGGLTRFDEAIDHLEKDAKRYGSGDQPVIPITLSLEGHRLSFFATLAQFGTPVDISVDEMKIELFFPMDDQTQAYFAQSKSF